MAPFHCSKIIVLLSAYLTWALCVFSVSRCTFFQQHNALAQQDVHLGLFSRAIYDNDGDLLGCASYTEGGSILFDSWFKIGRAFAIVAALCSSIFAIFMTVTILFCPRGSDVLWISGRFYVALATVGQMFSFFVLSSQRCQLDGEECTLSSAGKVAMANVVGLALLSIKVFFDSPPSYPLIAVIRDDDIEDTPTVRDSSQGNTPTVDEQTCDVESPMESSKPSLSEVTSKETTLDGSSSGARCCLMSSRWQSLLSFRLLAMLLVAATWSFSIVGVQHCTLVMVGPTGGHGSDFSGLGLFSRAAYSKNTFIGCLAYPDDAKDRFDTSFQVSRVFGTMASFLLTIVVILFGIQFFSSRAKTEVWLFVRVLLPCAAICQALVFIGFRTETCTLTDLVECRPGPTGIAVLVNIFLLLCLTVGSILTPAPTKPIFRIFDRQDARRQRQYVSSQQHEMRQYVNHQSGGPTSESDKITPMEPILESTPSASESASVQQSEYFEEVYVLADDEEYEEVEEEVDDDDSENSFEEVEIGTPLASESVSIRVEYFGTEKRTIKTVTHADGSQTITTTIEEETSLSSEESVESWRSDETEEEVIEVDAPSKLPPWHVSLRKTTPKSIEKLEPEGEKNDLKKLPPWHVALKKTSSAPPLVNSTPEENEPLVASKQTIEEETPVPQRSTKPLPPWHSALKKSRAVAKPVAKTNTPPVTKPDAPVQASEPTATEKSTHTDQPTEKTNQASLQNNTETAAAVTDEVQKQVPEESLEQSDAKVVETKPSEVVKTQTSDAPQSAKAEENVESQGSGEKNETAQSKPWETSRAENFNKLRQMFDK